MTWVKRGKRVSPDLTRNEKEKQGKGGGPYTNEAVGAENYGTLSYIIESPHEKGVIWTGSDDGLVYLTRDGGANWKNVTPNGLAECLINAIEVSPHDKATAYIATTRYKFNDHAPGLYKTTDYGNTWTKINNGLPAMHSRASCAKTTCAEIFCLRERSSACFCPGMAGKTGRRFS